jgi:O-antigen/teichoic acid export membrane protein
MSVATTTHPPRSGYRLDVLVSPGAGRAVIRGSAFRAGGYLLSVLLSGLSIPLMARHLGVADFGRFVTVLSLITIVAGIAEAGLMNIGVRELATRDEDTRWELMRNVIGMRAVLTVAGVVAAVAFTLVAGYPHVVIAGTGLAGAGLFAAQLQETLTIPLTTSLRLGPVSALALVRQVALVLTIVLLVAGGASLLPFYAASAIASAAALCATIVFTRRRVPLAPAFDVRVWRSLLRDVLPYAAATAMGAVVLQVTMIATSLLASERQTGYFATSFRVFEVLIGIGGILSLSAFPVLARAARDDPARLRFVLQKLFDVSAIGGLGTAVLASVGAGSAIHVLGGASYEPAVPVLRIQAVAIPFAFLVSTWGFALLALRRHRTLVAANAGALVVAASLSPILIPYAGAAGAAVCVLVTEIALAATYAFALARTRPDLRVSTWILPRVLSAGGIAALLTLASPLPSLAAALLAGALYVAGLTALGAIPAELRLRTARLTHL